MLVCGALRLSVAKVVKNGEPCKRDFFLRVPWRCEAVRGIIRGIVKCVFWV